MAIILEANYSKKLGLPNFSSHQFSVTIKTEVPDPAQVQGETTRLYGLLQTCVDREMQKPGGLPETARAPLNTPAPARRLVRRTSPRPRTSGPSCSVP